MEFSHFLLAVICFIINWSQFIVSSPLKDWSRLITWNKYFVHSFNLTLSATHLDSHKTSYMQLFDHYIMVMSTSSEMSVSSNFSKKMCLWIFWHIHFTVRYNVVRPLFYHSLDFQVKIWFWTWTSRMLEKRGISEVHGQF